MSYWPLLGVGVVVGGFALRLNPMLVVVSAGLTSGLAAGLRLPDLLALLGDSFLSSRAPLLVILTLPIVGLLEEAGLREHGRAWIASLRGMTLGRLLCTYLGLRQLVSMFGLTTLAGHAQTVRPLLAPMSEAAADKTLGSLDAAQRERVRALAAATDNVGLFFGEDVFIAFGAVLLIQGFYARNGIVLDPMAIALWALPTALAAYAVHAWRIRHVERHLRRELAARPEDGGD